MGRVVSTVSEALAPRAAVSANASTRRRGPERARARASAAMEARDGFCLLRQRAGDHDDGPIRMEVGPRRLVHLSGTVTAR